MLAIVSVACKAREVQHVLQSVESNAILTKDERYQHDSLANKLQALFEEAPGGSPRPVSSYESHRDDVPWRCYSLVSRASHLSWRAV